MKGKETEKKIDMSMPEERAEIIDWLKKLKLQKKLFGGVDERTVWKKMLELDGLYAKALEAQKNRYDAILEIYKKEGRKQDL
ncbi:MAG TPA: hypothetical protein VIR32_01305 [Lachnospiraceae bacterium]